MAEPAGPARPAGGIAVQRDPPAPAPGQRRRPHFAVRLVGIAGVQHQPWIGLVAGDSAPAGEHGLGDRHRDPVELALVAPAAGHVADPVVRADRQVPCRGVQAHEGDGLVVGGVADRGPAVDHVAVVVQPVVQDHTERVVPVGEADGEVQAVHVVTLVDPFHRGRAVGVPDGERRRPEPGTGADGQLVRVGQGLETAGPAVVRRQGDDVGQIERWSPVHVLRRVVLGQAQGVGGVRGTQQPQPVCCRERDGRHVAPSGVKVIRDYPCGGRAA